MRLIAARDAHELARLGADVIAAQLAREPRSLLALPTGRTPLGLYEELARRVRAGALSLRAARIVNLDEFLGIPPGDAASYAAFIQRHVVAPLGLTAEHVRLWRGDAADPLAETRALEAQIAAWGGIDLAILGLGANGHVAFNEPGTPRHRRAHVARLADSTRAAAQGPDGRPAPLEGLTLGLADLLEARRLLLLIAGAKPEARAALHRGIEDPQWPVTRLLGHPDLTVIELDARAASP